MVRANYGIAKAVLSQVSNARPGAPMFVQQQAARSLLIADCEPGLDFVERVIGDAQGGENLLASGLAFALLFNVAPGEPAPERGGENEAGGEALPENDAAMESRGAAEVALVEDAALEAGRRGAAHQGLPKSDVTVAALEMAQ